MEVCTKQSFNQKYSICFFEINSNKVFSLFTAHVEITSTSERIDHRLGITQTLSTEKKVFFPVVP